MKVLFTTLTTMWLGISLAVAQQPAPEIVRLNIADLTLEGTLSLPASSTDKKVPVVLLIAGSGPTDRDGNNPLGVSAATYRIIADSLNNRGIGVLRYDKRSIGKSVPADRSTFKEDNMRFEHGINDAVDWIKQLRTDKRISKIIVAGHSEGSLVGMVAARLGNADGFISLAGTGRVITAVLKEQLKTLPEQLRTVAYADLDSLQNGQLVRKPPVFLLSLLRPSVQPYIMSWMKYDPANEIRQFKGPVLIVQGKLDGQVATSEADLLKAARPDAPLLLFDHMTHTLKDAADASPQANMATYKDPNQPLTPGLASAIAEFVKKK